MLFIAFSMLFNAFSMLFNAFSMLSAAHATRLSFTMPQRRGAILRCDPAPAPVWARLACTWVQGNSQVRSSPGTACHGHAWARVPRRGRISTRTRAHGLRNVPEPFRNLVPAPQGTHCVVRRTAACSERDFTRSSVTARHRHGGHGTSKRHNANVLTSLWSFGSCRARGRVKNVAACSMLFNAFSMLFHCFFHALQCFFNALSMFFNAFPMLFQIECFSLLFQCFSMLFNACQCFFHAFQHLFKAF